MNLIENNIIVCFFDGACEPKNPGGNMGFGAVIYIDGKEWDSYSHFVPAGPLNSNNVAEYSAFLWVLQTLYANGYQDRVIKIYGDSNLVIEQMKGKWKIKKGMYVEKAWECRKLMAHFKNTLLQWIPRDQNYYADALSKGEMINHNVEFKIQPVK